MVPFIEISSADAARIGVCDGDFLELIWAGGLTIARACVTQVRKGWVRIPIEGVRGQVRLQRAHREGFELAAVEA
jgi:anaerobic selenocysteine-containing dehydrogenase